MSAYAVNRALHRLARDEVFREAARADPAEVLSDCGLEAQELEAMLRGDVAALFLLGTHPFLLNHLARFELCGLDQATYNSRIKTVMSEG